MTRRHARESEDDSSDVGFVNIVEDSEPQGDRKPTDSKELEKLRREHVFGDGSRIKPARLSDIQGMPHVVEDIKRFIAFLKDYQKFREKGARAEPGIFLYGEPGTGKTLTARIIATESGAKLIDAGGFPRDDIIWKAEDIHSIFTHAREYHAATKLPVIIYFDAWYSFLF
jgi:SpoVK/Ycf46/Vps4 family AAA+-type ATPase